MSDNNRPTIKKVSLVFALACVIFATVATILYKNHQIGSIGYSAPFVIGTVVAILSCAALQRLFCSLFGKGYFSFGCKVSPKTEAVSIGINTDNPKVLSQTDNTASAGGANPQVKQVLDWIKTQIGQADQVVEEWHDENGFYRKHASGFIEQAGQIPAHCPAVPQQGAGGLRHHHPGNPAGFQILQGGQDGAERGENFLQ